MNPFFRLTEILLYFQPLFNRQNFALFCAFSLGFLFYPGRKTVTGLYIGSQPRRRYWSMLKFLSRSKWDAEWKAKPLLFLLQTVFKHWVYVYDETHAQTTGKAQFGLHFVRFYRYQKRNRNQSKFHWGHQFAALGLLCLSAGQTLLFPVWVKMLLPQDAVLNRLAVLETILSQIPMGRILFDRGFNHRKVFKILLGYGHHLWCRAKSNAVFYYLPKPAEQPKRGRRRKYGKRVDVPKRHFKNRQINGQRVSVAEAMVRTKRCPEPVRLVVKRVKPKPGTPYRYFMVYTTDLLLPIETILHSYRLRWELETDEGDTKQNFGFDAYQVQSQNRISRLVQLSFVAASLTQWLFARPQSAFSKLTVEEVLETLGIHWYHPKKLTKRSGLDASVSALPFLLEPIFGDKSQKDFLAENTPSHRRGDIPMMGGIERCLLTLDTLDTLAHFSTLESEISACPNFSNPIAPCSNPQSSNFSGIGLQTTCALSPDLEIGTLETLNLLRMVSR